MSIFDIQKDEYQICTQLLLFLHSKWYASKLCWICIASFYNCILIEYPVIQKRLNKINRFEPSSKLSPCLYVVNMTFVHIYIAVGDPAINVEVLRVINQFNTLSHILHQSYSRTWISNAICLRCFMCSIA